MSLITDQFLASLMVMFRILSLISCHFEAWGYFFIASKQTARPGSRPCIISSRNCFLSLFSWSSGHVRRVVPPGLGLCLPLVVFFRFLLTVVSNSSEMSPVSPSPVPSERLFLLPEVEALDLLSELSAPSPDLAWSVLSWPAVSLSLAKQLLITQMKSIRFYINDFVLANKVPFYVFEGFENQRDVIENRPSLSWCMFIVHNLDVYCFVGSMIQKKRNVNKNGFVLLQ